MILSVFVPTERPFNNNYNGGGGEETSRHFSVHYQIIGLISGIALGYFFGWWSVILLFFLALALKIILWIAIAALKELIQHQ